MVQSNLSPYLTGDFSDPNDPKNKYSKEEQAKAYKTVYLGMTKKMFEKVMPQNIEVINGNKYEIKTKFTYDGKLIWIQFRSKFVQDDKEIDLKKDLIDIITTRYGECTRRYKPFMVPADDFISKREVLSNVETYFWDIGDKKVKIAGIPKWDQDVSGTDQYLVYPTLTIYSDSLKEVHIKEVEGFVDAVIKEINDKKKDESNNF
ncbi:hypothetical protein [Sphingobacterium paucimobilis]|nr:hypothetical protein [Sphingobacterium paucimobilis]